jgi:hypothetical protein
MRCKGLQEFIGSLPCATSPSHPGHQSTEDPVSHHEKPAAKKPAAKKAAAPKKAAPAKKKK